MRGSLAILGCALSLTWSCVACTPTLAAPGTPDNSFGSGGVATYELGFGNYIPFSRFAAIGVSAAGRIYAAGVSGNSGGEFKMLAARVSDNGTLDPSFGSGGAVINDPVDQGSIIVAGANALSIEPDESIVTGGSLIERLTAAGQFDSSFAPNGIPLRIEALKRLSDGTLAVLGYQDMQAKRESAEIEVQLSNGRPDPSFGEGGYLVLPLHAGEYSKMDASAAVQQTDGRLVLAGSGSYALAGNEAARSYCWLARLTRSGTLDTGFGQGGVIFLEGRAGACLLEARPGGLVLVGNSPSGADGAFAVTAWGLTADGLPDASFGNGGATQIPIPAGYDTAGLSAATIDASARLLVAGQLGNTSDQTPVPPLRPELARLQPNGQLDTSFGEGGIALGPLQSRFHSLAVDLAGRVLAAGDMATAVRGQESEGAMIERFTGGPPAPPSSQAPAPARLGQGLSASARAALAAALGRQVFSYRACASRRALRRHRRCAVHLHVGVPGTVVLHWWARAHAGKHKRRVLIAAGRVTLPPSGRGTLVLRLTHAGVRLLGQKRGPLRVTAVARLTLRGQPPIHLARRFTLPVR
jgi:uncharacterized delta-60 repeat protein